MYNLTLKYPYRPKNSNGIIPENRNLEYELTWFREELKKISSILSMF